jgi:hypothetical protein
VLGRVVDWDSGRVEVRRRRACKYKRTRDVKASEIAQRQLGRVDGATNVDIENDERGRFQLMLLVKSVDKDVLGALSNPGICEDDVYSAILLGCFLEDVELVVPAEN